jgi:hypothetical protein
MDQIRAHFESKARDTGVVLSTARLLEYAKAKGLSVSKRKLVAFRKDHPLVAEFSPHRKTRYFASVGVLRPGVWFIDFAEYRKTWSASNKGYVGFLLAVENVTHKLHVVPVTNKSSASWDGAITELVELRRDVETLISDRDSVVTSDKFIGNLKKKYGVKWYYLYKNSKSWLAEVFIRYIKQKLSQATLASGRSRQWARYLPAILADHNTAVIPGTSYRRQAVRKENWAHFLQQVLKSKEPEMRFSSSRIGDFRHGAWNAKIFKFKLGQRVLLAKKANWKKPLSTFHKASVKGSFGSTPVTISGRQLRKTKDYKRVLPGKSTPAAAVVSVVVSRRRRAGLTSSFFFSFQYTASGSWDRGYTFMKTNSGPWIS